MAYSKQTWDTNSIFNPTRMNHIEQGIEDSSVVVTELTQDNFYWSTSSQVLSSGVWLSRASLSQLIGTRRLLGYEVHIDYVGAASNIVYNSTLDKFVVYGFGYDPTTGNINPVNSSSTFKVRILSTNN